MQLNPKGDPKGPSSPYVRFSIPKRRGSPIIGSTCNVDVSLSASFTCAYVVKYPRVAWEAGEFPGLSSHYDGTRSMNRWK